MTGSPHLHAARRALELEQLAGGEPVDLVVVGGGITGVGVALDAASRGLSVALLERQDLAHGTSRWSSKLVHGGLRYLAQGQIGVAAESARERAILIRRTAPHLCRPLATVMPFADDTKLSKRLVIQTGFRLGDALRAAAGTSSKVLPRSRTTGIDTAREFIPLLRDNGLKSALIAWDGQLEDDARLVVAIARTAAAHGAKVITRCGVTSVERGQVHCVDQLTGQSLTINAGHVINATGVWAGELAESVRLRPSKGSHVIVSAGRLGNPSGSLTVPATGDGGSKYVFAIPANGDRVIIGLTDQAFEGPIPDEPTVDPDEERFLLETISSALEAPLTSDDVIGRYAGFRPLLEAGGQAQGATSDMSRKHSVIEEPASSMITIVGGKLTTYRKMAEDAVDRVTDRDGVTAGPCATKNLPLVGAQGIAPAEARVSATAAAAAAAAASAVDSGAVALDGAAAGLPERLIRRYGSEAADVAALADVAPELLDPVADGVDVLGVEFAFATRSELALTTDDLLDRRTRTGLVPAERALAEAAAQSMIENPASVD